MTLPKKKSRKIQINDTNYRWVSNGNDHGVDLYVELAEEPGQLLHAIADYEYDLKNNQIAVTTVHVRELVFSALEEGWLPSENKPTYHYKKDIKLKSE